jgi:hypothetical protein
MTRSFHGHMKYVMELRVTCNMLSRNYMMGDFESSVFCVILLVLVSSACEMNIQILW